MKHYNNEEQASMEESYCLLQKEVQPWMVVESVPRHRKLLSADRANYKVVLLQHVSEMWQRIIKQQRPFIYLY